MLQRDHVRFEFHQPFSTSISVVVDGHTIPVEVVRPVWTAPFTRAEWNWNWTWPDGSRYQLVCPVHGISRAVLRMWLNKEGQTLAEGFLRGPRFVPIGRGWVWQRGTEKIETRYRLGCRPRTFLREGRKTLATCFGSRGRRRGVIRGRLDSPRAPLLIGMLLSVLVDIPYDFMPASYGTNVATNLYNNTSVPLPQISPPAQPD